ncbi:TPA: glycosyltransferase family 2 protein [Candidatus Woesearchaeota archaeon]|nr:glycosyltransferase family 2 protein [Candidatus Woesearchaeota archaeon]
MINANAKKPLLSIGMPVWNAENYIKEALDSILRQSFKDFELIISDNGSTDNTQKICEQYARKDKHIRYIRHNENKGAAWNYNFVVSLASGKYFKWAAHDDNLDPKFLKKCIDVLEKDESIILAYTRAKLIDAKGKVIKLYTDKLNLNFLRVGVRYKGFHDAYKGYHECNAVFGIIRTDVLRKTEMIANYVGSDILLMGNLSLLGKFFEVPEYLFHLRIHQGNSTYAYRTENALQSWYDPSKDGKLVLRSWRFLWEYFKAINRVKMNLSERMLCYWELDKFSWRNKKRLLRESIIFILWPFIKLFKK